MHMKKNEGLKPAFGDETHTCTRIFQSLLSFNT
jgi:hypothetical protein